MGHYNKSEYLELRCGPSTYCLFGLVLFRSYMHWVYLEIFIDEHTRTLFFYFLKIFEIHLFLLGVTFFGDAFHVRGLYGPGIRVSDSYGLTGRVQYVNLVWGVEGFDPFVPRGITSHHIAASKDLGHIGRSIPS